jgi:hypothetical protein
VTPLEAREVAAVVVALLARAPGPETADPPRKARWTGRGRGFVVAHSWQTADPPAGPTGSLSR